MQESKKEIVVYHGPDGAAPAARGDGTEDVPAIVRAAGGAAAFAWDEFFRGEIANRYTRANYLHAVRRFLAWVEGRGLDLVRVTPGDVGGYLQGLPLSTTTKKLHLAALRRFFDRLVNQGTAQIAVEISFKLTVDAIGCTHYSVALGIPNSILN